MKRAMALVKSIGIPTIYDDLYDFKKYLEGKRGKKPDMVSAWTAAAVVSYRKDNKTPEAFVKKTLETCLYYEETPENIFVPDYAEF